MIVQTRTLALVALDDTINDISKKFINDIQEAERGGPKTLDWRT